MQKPPGAIRRLHPRYDRYARGIAHPPGATSHDDPGYASSGAPDEDLHGRLPEGTLNARLISPVTSETAKRGDPVEAIITRPLWSADHTQMLVPQGTHIHGVVVRTKAARSFGRNGDLRFAFRNLDLPSADGAVKVTEIHGRLSAPRPLLGSTLPSTKRDRPGPKRDQANMPSLSCWNFGLCGHT